MQQDLSEFRLITGCSALLMVAILAFQVGESGRRQQLWQQTQAAKSVMQSQAEMQRTQLETSAQMAEVRAENPTLTPPPGLRLTDYTFHNEPPNLSFLSVVDPAQRTIIFDKYGNCIGSSFQQQFTFLKNDKQACDL